MNTKENLKKLEDDRTDLKVHPQGCLFFPIAFLLWGISLIYLLRNGGSLTSPVFFYPVCFFIAGLILFGVVGIYRYINPSTVITDKFDPRQQARKVVGTTLMFSLFLMIPIMMLVAGFAIGSIFFLIFGTLFLVVLSLWMLGRIREVFRLYSSSRKFGISTIFHIPTHPKIGENISIKITNKELAKQKMEMTATLFNLSERYERKKSKDGKELITYIRYEETHPFIFDEPTKEFNFFLSSDKTLPTQLGPLTDYWELQIKNETENYFARFILDIQNT